MTAVVMKPAFDPITPLNFHLGTYAGYYTYQEYLDELDAMASTYPNLITTRVAIDTFFNARRQAYILG
jgi:carboxypeptidase T